MIATGSSNGTIKGSNGKTPDHETMTRDTNRSSRHYGRIYVGFAEFSGSGRSPIDIAYSDDNGATWTGPVRVSDSNHQFDQDARPSVAPNGDVFMTWTNGPNEKSLNNNAAMADIPAGSISCSMTAARMRTPLVRASEYSCSAPPRRL